MPRSSFYVCFDVSIPCSCELLANTSVVVCSDLQLVVFCTEEEIENHVSSLFPNFEVYIKEVYLYNR